MKRLTYCIFLGAICLFALPVTGQDSTAAVENTSNRKGDRNKANQYYDDENYKDALEELKLLLKEEPEDIGINYLIGACYLKTEFEKIKAIPYFQKVLFYDEEDAAAYYMMGLAYHSNQEFDRAIDMFNNFKKFYRNGGDFSISDAEKQIEYCENAYELVKFPVKCRFENLGPGINSEYPDYFPYVPLDESYLIFTSQRNDGSAKKKDGNYRSNIYISHVKDGEFMAAEQIGGGVNTPDGDETVIGLTGEGDKVLLYLTKNDEAGDISIADYLDVERLVSTPKVFDKGINSKYSEIAATLTADGNAIFFASDRPGGFGGTDLYVSKKLPTGDWGVPQNLGSSINTEFNEDFPNISPDGTTLFFSSTGHFSMGGFDIFKAKFNEEKGIYDNPRNIGYPVNTVGDDVNYRQSSSGRYGYMAATRKEGFGDLDIYRVTIESIESEYSVIKGHIKSMNESQEIDFVDIYVTDLTTGELYGTYKPNPKSMRYIIILPPGKYEVLVEADDFEPSAIEIDILGKSSFQSEIDREILLSPAN